MAKPKKIRAARAGLARGLDDRRVRRNAGKQALSRLEIGDGLMLDSRSRLTTTPTQATQSTAPRSSLPALMDDTNATASNFVIGAVAATTAITGVVTTAQAITALTNLQVEIEASLDDIRENLATLTRRVNELSK